MISADFFPLSRRLLSALALCLLSGASQAASLQLDELMGLLAQNKRGQATFIEKKYLGIVDTPVESSGELFFTAPDKLEKRTLRPKVESLVLDGKRMVVERPGKGRLSVNLDDYPEALAFIASIRGTLAGDRSALEKVYRLTLSGAAEKWQLALEPQSSRMSEVVTRILIQGRRGDIDRIDFDLADGDRSELFVTKVAVQP